MVVGNDAAVQTALVPSVPTNCLQEISSKAKAGAQIPPELFDPILFYVDCHCPRSTQSRRSGANRILRRRQTIDNVEDVACDLKACSLVCRHWALRCRQYVFHRVTLAISSYEDAHILVKYALSGCPSLPPIHKLAWKITVVQDYQGDPFCYRLHLLRRLTNPSFFYQLRICGPVPEKFPPGRLDTPHWDVPPFIVTPPSLLPYMHIRVENLNFPSFSHLLKYIRHFTHASHSIFFSKVTWGDGKRKTDPLPRFRQLRSLRRKIDRVDAMIFAEKSTDNFRLCLFMAMVQSHCVLHRLSDDELQSAISLMASPYQLYSAKDISARDCGLRWNCQTLEDLSEIGLTLIPQDGGTVRSDCRFIFGNSFPRSRMQSLLAFRAVLTKDDIPIDLEALLNLLANHSTLQIIHLDFFDDYGHLRRSMQPLLRGLNPQLATLTFILTCQRSRYHPFSEVPSQPDGEYDSIGIDPVTLSPTGQSWSDWSYVVPSILQSSGTV